MSSTITTVGISLLILLMLFVLIPITVYLCAKLGTYGYLVAKKKFNSNYEVSDGDSQG